MTTLAMSVNDIKNKTRNSGGRKEMEKALIKSMAGCYKVIFQFAETFAPEKDYNYGARKFEQAIEYIFILEESENKVSLQHLLYVGNGMIIKHWRQDWIYENSDLLQYTNENEWTRIQLDNQIVKGTWTQKVFQVDDSPRYEGFGTWNHVDGRHFWESTTDAPLPRREIMIRNDYNVIKRHSHIEIFENGDWIIDQDNEKIIRKDGKDTLLCMEKGLEKFFTGDYDSDNGAKWWKEHKDFWDDVRKCWDEKIKSLDLIKIQNKVSDEFLYMALFKLSDQFTASKGYNAQSAIVEINKVLDVFVNAKN